MISVGIREVEVELAGDPAHVGLPIDEHENPLRAEALKHHTGPHGMATLELETCPSREKSRQIGCSDVLNLTPRDDFRRDRNVRQPLQPPARRHN